MAKLLLKHGANMELGFKFYNKEITPLTIAIEKGYKQMVQLLLEQGAQY
jgi:ankyrin repeat protein